MKKFRMHYANTYYNEYEIDAENEEQARKIWKQLWDEGEDSEMPGVLDGNEDGCEITDVEELVEVDGEWITQDEAELFGDDDLNGENACDQSVLTEPQA
jgi:hypothetical protein